MGQQGPQRTPHSHTASLRTPHSSPSMHYAPVGTIPAESGLHTPEAFGATAEPGAVLVPPSPLQLHVHDVLYPGIANRVPCPGYLCGVWCLGHTPSTGVPRCDAAPRAWHPSAARRWGAGRPGRAVASRAQRGREPAGAGAARRPGRVPSSVCSRGPSGTYPAPVPTQRGAGRPAGAQARACAVPWSSPPRATGTARGTGHHGGGQVGTEGTGRAVAGLGCQTAVGIKVPGDMPSPAQELAAERELSRL